MTTQTVAAPVMTAARRRSRISSHVTRRATENIAPENLNAYVDAIAVEPKLDKGQTEQGAAHALGWPTHRFSARVKLLEPQRMIGGGELQQGLVGSVLAGDSLVRFLAGRATMSFDADNHSRTGSNGESRTSLAWPESMPVLTDGSLTLRPWRAADADAVLAACQDPEVQRWMDVPVPFLPQHAADFVGAHAEQQWSSRQGAPFAISASNEDRVLGSCGLVAVDAADLVAQVVWAVDAPARGQRVAQRAGKLLCDWALEDLGFARLEFYIEPTNAASRAVATRLGCELEGILRSKSWIQRTRRDVALYALLG